MRSPLVILGNGSTVIAIHFIYCVPSQDGSNVVSWLVACSPFGVRLTTEENQEQVWLRSPDPRAVTCSACQATREYQQALAALEATGR